jgi:hypothetical protein
MIAVRYLREKVEMNIIVVLLMAVFLVMMVLPAWGYDREVRGFFKGHKNHSVTIELDRGMGHETVNVDSKTKVINIGVPMELPSIPKNSFVKVKIVDSVAAEIIVEEVPK